MRGMTHPHPPRRGQSSRPRRSRWWLAVALQLLAATATVACHANDELPDWIDGWADGYDPADVGSLEGRTYTPFARQEILRGLHTMSENARLAKNRACECGLVSRADNCAAYSAFAPCGDPFDEQCLEDHATDFTDDDFALLEDFSDAIGNVHICTIDWTPGTHCNWIRDCFEPFTARMEVTCPLRSATLAAAMDDCTL